jgi:ketosteroid isomerase-like protein
MIKKISFALVLLATTILLSNAYAQQQQQQAAALEVVQSAINAYNAKDLAYFEKRLSPDVVWIDEDGHMVNGKNGVMNFLRIQLDGAKTRKLTATNIKTNGTTDAMWGMFAFTIEAAGEKQKGMNSTVFRKVGNEWMIAMVHGAYDSPSHH